MKKLILIVFLISSTASARKLDLSPRWNVNQHGASKEVEVKNTTVISHGVEYKQLQIEGKTYILKMRQSSYTQSEEDIECLKPGSELADTHLIEASTKFERLPSFFVEALKKKCAEKPDGKKHTELSPTVRMGVNIGDPKKEEKKKLWYAPFQNMLGFTSDW